MTVNEPDSDVRQARRSVLLSYGVITLVGAVGFALSFQYEFFRYGDQVGPGFLPRIVAAIIVLLGISLMLQEVRVGSILRGDSGVDDEGDGQQTSTRKLVVVFGLIILAVLMTPVLGLIPPLVALVAALTMAVERKPLVPSLLLTAGAALVAWGLFVAVLRVPVPMGLFEGVLS